jgi:hypothetical protein
MTAAKLDFVRQSSNSSEASLNGTFRFPHLSLPLVIRVQEGFSKGIEDEHLALHPGRRAGPASVGFMQLEDTRELL